MEFRVVETTDGFFVVLLFGESRGKSLRTSGGGPSCTRGTTRLEV